jgi:hypothetical protein
MTVSKETKLVVLAKGFELISFGFKSGDNWVTRSTESRHPEARKCMAGPDDSRSDCTLQFAIANIASLKRKGWIEA